LSMAGFASRRRLPPPSDWRPAVRLFRLRGPPAALLVPRARGGRREDDHPGRVALPAFLEYLVAPAVRFFPRGALDLDCQQQDDGAA